MQADLANCPIISLLDDNKFITIVSTFSSLIDRLWWCGYVANPNGHREDPFLSFSLGILSYMNMPFFTFVMDFKQFFLRIFLKLHKHKTWWHPGKLFISLSHFTIKILRSSFFKHFTKTFRNISASGAGKTASSNKSWMFQYDPETKMEKPMVSQTR